MYLFENIRRSKKYWHLYNYASEIGQKNYIWKLGGGGSSEPPRPPLATGLSETVRDRSMVTMER